MCFYVRLSGKQHGFHNMEYSQAFEAAKELGAVKQVTAYANNKQSLTCKTVFSISFFNSDNEEIFLYSHALATGQVFEPPRKVAEKFLYDHVL